MDLTDTYEIELFSLIRHYSKYSGIFTLSTVLWFYKLLTTYSTVA